MTLLIHRSAPQHPLSGGRFFRLNRPLWRYCSVQISLWTSLCKWLRRRIQNSKESAHNPLVNTTQEASSFKINSGSSVHRIELDTKETRFTIQRAIERYKIWSNSLLRKPLKRSQSKATRSKIQVNSFNLNFFKRKFNWRLRPTLQGSSPEDEELLFIGRWLAGGARIAPRRIFEPLQGSLLLRTQVFVVAGPGQSIGRLLWLVWAAASDLYLCGNVASFHQDLVYSFGRSCISGTGSNEHRSCGRYCAALVQHLHSSGSVDPSMQ